MSSPVAPQTFRAVIGPHRSLSSPGQELVLSSQEAFGVSRLPHPTPAHLEEPGEDVWTNEAAGLCIGVNTVAFIANKIVAELLVPWFDAIPVLAAWGANLALKFCAPLVFVPPDVSRTSAPGECAVEVRQPVMNTTWSMGGDLVGALFEAVFDETFNGAFGWPVVAHFNSDVEITLLHRGTPLGNGVLRFPVGRHALTWRADTLIAPGDYVPIYLPSRKGAVLRLSSRQKRVLDRVNAVQAFAEEVLSFFDGVPHGIFNNETQHFYVLDTGLPNIATSQPVFEIEALQPGGITKSLGINGGAGRAGARSTITFSDDCDAFPQLNFPGPAFWPLDITLADEEKIDLVWTVSDNGPVNPDGSGSNSRSITQRVRVVDTIPPILLAPPGRVIESVTTLTDLDLGTPQVFDLADLNATVRHDAPGEFPVGQQTLVTWEAEDLSGNRSVPQQQLITVKRPGVNRPPLAQAQSVEAFSFEPLTITLTAMDQPDNDLQAPLVDPLAFSVATPPAHGFFVAPLYPYFIDDYRIENAFDADELRALCGDSQVPREQAMSAFEQARQAVQNPEYITVSDSGQTYVIDRPITCNFSRFEAVGTDRIATFDAQGNLAGAFTNFGGSVPDSLVFQTSDAQGQRFLYYAVGPTSVTNGQITKLDPTTLELLENILFDKGPAGIFVALVRVIDAVIDRNGLIYATDGQQLVVYDSRQEDSSGRALFLGNVFVTLQGEQDGVIFGNAFDMALDSTNHLYVADQGRNRIYRFAPSSVDADGQFVAGELLGWLGKCDAGAGCDVEAQRSIGYSCTDDTCAVTMTRGSAQGQFDNPHGIAVDPNDTLYVTDFGNARIQRFTPEGFFAGEAISECDGNCFVLGDFGRPLDVSVNSTHFYVLDRDFDLLHVFETTPIMAIDGTSASIEYVADFGYLGPDSFGFRVSDGLETDVATVNINVVPLNDDVPLAEAGLMATTAEDTAVDIILSGFDPDGTFDPLTFGITEAPTNGRLTSDGAVVTYIPDRDFAGTDRFHYFVSDGTFDSVPEVVTMTVTPVNDPPVVQTEPTMTAGVGFQFAYSAAVNDPDANDTHRIVIDWGDGTVEQQGMFGECVIPTEDDTTGCPVSGPLLVQQPNGGGLVSANHLYTDAGMHTVTLCVTDAAGAQSCGTTAVEVFADAADLSITVVASGEVAQVGQAVDYRLLVSNLLPNEEVAPGREATEVTVTYTLAPHVAFNTAVPSQGRCDFVQDTVICTLGTLAASAEASIDLQVTPLGVINDELVLSQNVAVSAAQADPNGGNSIALTATVVECLGDGDVNQDGSLTPLDAVLAWQDYLGTATSPLGVCQQDRANVAGARGDRSTPADARCIFQAALGMTSCLTAP